MLTKYFSKKDLKQIRKKGIPLDIVEQQLNNFRQGFPYVNIVKAAIISDGIVKLSAQAINQYIEIYQHGLKTKNIIKFVPASGAATRMFKDLYSFIEIYHGAKINYEAFMKANVIKTIYQFFSQIQNFAFYEDLKHILSKQGKNIDELLKIMDYVSILDALLEKQGLNYRNLPKGLLKFHKYDEYIRTPVEEHLVEGANYCLSSAQKVRIHFTVSKEHKTAFIKHINKVKKLYKKSFNLKFEISFSEQKSKTDTIAVDLQNKPFRNEDDSILFRPGGHGALIENLNEINADIIFIKNIDNVVPDKLKPVTYIYKKALAGILLAHQEKIFNYLYKLENTTNNNFSPPFGRGRGWVNKLIEEVSSFLKNELCVLPPENLQLKNIVERAAYVFNKLNRPIRVCGMVKNEGEAGGGPFWLKNSDGTVSLQIVESSQVALNNAGQNNIFQNATHFNPVDMVCAVKDYKGKKFDLLKFRDPATGIISKKSKDGKELKAQELPGLWNGAMAEWNTIFVDMPIITFNPVKMITDLLRKEHQ